MKPLPFHPQPKAIPRLSARQEKRRAAQQAWIACCRTVDQRDQYRCRVCGRRVRRTFDVVPERLEHHHLVGRRVAPGLLCEPRAILSVCLECHGKLTRHELVAVGTAKFERNGQVYLDAGGRITFSPAG